MLATDTSEFFLPSFFLKDLAVFEVFAKGEGTQPDAGRLGAMNSQAEISDTIRRDLDLTWPLVRASLTFSGKND